MNCAEPKAGPYGSMEWPLIFRRAAALALGMGMAAHLQPLQAAPPSQSTVETWPIESQIGGATSQVFVDGDWLYHTVGPRLVARDLFDPAGNTESWRSGLRLPGRLLLVDSGVVYFTNGQELSAHGAEAELPRLSSIELPNPTGLAAFGSPKLLFLMGNDTESSQVWLEIVDTSDPTTLRSVGQWRYDVGPRTYVTGFAIEGDQLMVSIVDQEDWQLELLVLDVRDPERVEQVGRAEWGGWRSVRASSGGVLVSLASGAVAIADLSDSAGPREVALIDLPRDPVDVELFGTVLLVLMGCTDYDVCDDGGSRVQAFDISDPVNPIEVAALHFEADFPTSLALRDSFVYVAGGASGLFVIDAADPAAMTLVTTHDAQPASARDITTAGDRIVVSDVAFAYGHERAVLLEHDPIDGLQVSGGGEAPIDWGYPQIVASERAGYFVEHTGSFRDRDAKSRLWRIDLDEESGPRPVSTTLRFDDTVMDLALGGDLLVAARRHEVVVVDVARPGEEAVVGRHVNRNRIAIDVVVQGAFAYVLRLHDPEWSERIEVLDLSDPTRPELVGSAPLPRRDAWWRSANSLAIVDGLLIAHGQYLFDLSDPATPATIGALRRDGDALTEVAASAFRGSSLLLGSHECLRVIDLTDLRAPRQIGVFELRVDAMAVVADHVFTADYNFGVHAMHLDHPPLTTFSEACQPFDWGPMRHGVPQVSRIVLPVVLSWR